jgi:hypothetical protein
MIFKKPFPNKRKMERKYLFRDAKQDKEWHLKQKRNMRK